MTSVRFLRRDAVCVHDPVHSTTNASAALAPETNPSVRGYFGVALVLLAVLAPCRALSQGREPPLVVFEALAQGQPQDLLVLFDDRKFEEATAGLRLSRSLRAGSQETLAQKSAYYKELRRAALSSMGPDEVTVLQDYSHLPSAFVRLYSESALRRLLSQPQVLAVYENRVYRAALTESLPLIHQPQVTAAGKIGTGTTVAVLDTGVDYTKSFFGSCSAPGTPTSCKVVYAYDFAPDDGSLDDDGHGTNVSAIVLGVAPDTRIAALDVFDACRLASDSYIQDAINWSIANQASYNIVAMNLSLGADAHTELCVSDPLAVYLARAKAAGIVPVVAAGNDGQSDAISRPACAPAAVSVGAVYDADFLYRSWCTRQTTTGCGTAICAATCEDWIPSADQVPCFSNSAAFLTLLAPGAEITAGGITAAGTSQAAPHVAGAVAVLRAAFSAESLDQTVARMSGGGLPVTDSRNGITKPRLGSLAFRT